jgi:hypothetical protein
VNSSNLAEMQSDRIAKFSPSQRAYDVLTQINPPVEAAQRAFRSSGLYAAFCVYGFCNYGVVAVVVVVVVVVFGDPIPLGMPGTLTDRLA